MRLRRHLSRLPEIDGSLLTRSSSYPRNSGTADRSEKPINLALEFGHLIAIAGSVTCLPQLKRSLARMRRGYSMNGCGGWRSSQPPRSPESSLEYRRRLALPTISRFESAQKIGYWRTEIRLHRDTSKGW